MFEEINIHKYFNIEEVITILYMFYICWDGNSNIWLTA
jgi:hypothetical protein